MGGHRAGQGGAGLNWVELAGRGGPGRAEITCPQVPAASQEEHKPQSRTEARDGGTARPALRAWGLGTGTDPRVGARFWCTDSNRQQPEEGGGAWN